MYYCTNLMFMLLSTTMEAKNSDDWMSEVVGYRALS